MFLEKMELIHFRKFNEKENIVHFVRDNSEKKGIDITTVSTLIMGQNNAGKSTIFKAFDMLSKNKMFSATDFNYEYLISYIEELIIDERDENNEYKMPRISFKFTVDISDDENESLISISKFLPISSLHPSSEEKKAQLIIEVGLKNESILNFWIQDRREKYLNAVKLAADQMSFEKRKFLNDLMSKINDIGLTLIFYNPDKKIDNIKFSDVFNYNLITALSVNDEKVLSKQFKSIINYHFSQGDIKPEESISDKINELNDDIRKLLQDKPTNFINSVIENIVSKNRIKMALDSDLSFEKLLETSVKYFYSEKEVSIPEDQYGLGYTKLVSIVANLLEYVEKKPENDFDNKISIVAIEEPETFMHPQLQKCFMENINEVLNKIFDNSNKKVKCQIMISTHSPYIVANKIKESNSVSNINYLGIVNNKTFICLLEDSLFESNNNIPFNNLKKHMTLSFVEAMFADGIIVVEGFAEEKLLPYFLSNYAPLKNNFISIVNINGAHGFIFKKLLMHLKIPTVVLTDIDFVNPKSSQIIEYKDQKTTNQTIIDSIKTNELSKLTSCVIDVTDTLKIIIQKPENGYCGTSFEEAVILANYKNMILCKSLKKTSRNSFYSIIKHKGVILKTDLVSNKFKLNEKSHLLYNMLLNKKSEFTLNLLKYAFESSESLNTPSYIIKAFEFLDGEVNSNEK